MVTFVATDSRVTDTLTGFTVTLVCSGAVRVTVASMTVNVRVTPEVGLALITLASTESLLTGTLSIVRITLFAHGSHRIAVTCLTSLSASDLPMVFDTLLAVLSAYVSQAGTLTGEPITMLYRLISSQHVAVTWSTALFQSISIVSIPTELAVISFRIVQTLQTLTRFGIAITRLIQIHIVATVALLTDTSRSFRIAKVVVRADIALGSCVTLVAQTDYIVRLRIEQTLVGIRVSGSDRIRTTARPAADLRTQQRVSIITVQAPVALPTLREVLTLEALSGFRVTRRRVPVTFAHLTVREVPESWLALIALSSISVRVTVTLSGYQIAIIILRSNAVTIASFASLRPKSVRSRCTLVALAPNDIGLASTVSTEFLAFLRRRSGWITFTWCCSVEDENADHVHQIFALRASLRIVVHIVVRLIAP